MLHLKNKITLQLNIPAESSQFARPTECNMIFRRSITRNNRNTRILYELLDPMTYNVRLGNEIIEGSAWPALRNSPSYTQQTLEAHKCRQQSTFTKHML